MNNKSETSENTEINIYTLETLVKKYLSRDFTPEQSTLMTDVLMFGELSGRKSHGIGLLTREDVVWKNRSEREDPETTHTNLISTSIDAKGNPGILVGHLAMEESIRLGRENGIGIVTTKGSFSTIGALSYYAEKIGNENLIGIIMSTSRPVVAPFTSKEPLFGSNPIAIVIPSDLAPVILDMSTAALSFGTVMEHKVLQKELPEGVLIDKHGNPTIDPAHALEGALLPFGGYKGAGISMMIELLTSTLGGSSFQGKHAENGRGNLFITISPSVVGDIKDLKESAREFIENLRKIPTSDGKPMRTPGENTRNIRDMNIKNGTIIVSSSVLKKLSA